MRCLFGVIKIAICHQNCLAISQDQTSRDNKASGKKIFVVIKLFKECWMDTEWNLWDYFLKKRKTPRFGRKTSIDQTIWSHWSINFRSLIWTIRTCRAVVVSVTRLGNFSKFLPANCLTKLSQIFGDFLDYWKTSIIWKNCCGYL